MRIGGPALRPPGVIGIERRVGRAIGPGPGIIPSGSGSRVRRATSTEIRPVAAALPAPNRLAAFAVESISLAGTLAVASSDTSTTSVPPVGVVPLWRIRFTSIDLALDDRPETVSTGTPSCSAASLRVRPSRSHRTMGTRYFSGRRLNSSSSNDSRSSRRSSNPATGSGMSGTWPSRARLLARIALAFIAV